jgi:ring-1,2-phenylacetyl-CoA epoxidase subunit PaaC
MEQNALIELLYKLADDLLIYGHRNSEWIGLGPLLEEDISFASIAQDKVGQSRVLYNLLHQLGETDADTVAFMRNAHQFHNCTLVELPTQLYEEALVRHFFMDEAQAIFFEALRASTQPDLAAFASKFTGEIKYHTLHGRAMVRRLLTSTDEARTKMETAILKLWPYAGGIFEESPFEKELNDTGIILSIATLKERWISTVNTFMEPLGIQNDAILLGHEGGRVGTHTEHLQPMLDEMSEVYKLDPTAEW